MTMDAMPYGFRILGPSARERKLVDYQRAFAAYAACDPLAEVDSLPTFRPFSLTRLLLPG